MNPVSALASLPWSIDQIVKGIFQIQRHTHSLKLASGFGVSIIATDLSGCRMRVVIELQ